MRVEEWYESREEWYESGEEWYESGEEWLSPQSVLAVHRSIVSDLMPTPAIDQWSTNFRIPWTTNVNGHHMVDDYNKIVAYLHLHEKQEQTGNT
ncbi:hypothetical protein TNCV_2265881 [Trichonephila clavipes]|nr:hypothetical protein TNCV_2265881 [Trichonephila clavipes]